MVYRNVEIACLLALVLLSGAAQAQETVVHTIAPAQRLGLQQLDQLVAEGRASSAIERVIELMDSAEGRLVPLDGPSTSGGFVRHVPLSTYLNDRVLRWGIADPDVLASYRRRVDGLAREMLGAAVRERDLAALHSVIARYLASSVGDRALRAAGDLCWDRGWVDAARSLYERIDPRFRASAAASRPAEQADSVAWDHALRRVPPDQFAAVAEASGDGFPLGTYIGTDLPLGSIAVRLVACSALSGDAQRAEREAAFYAGFLPDEEVSLGGKTQPLGEALAAAAAIQPAAADRGASEWPLLGGAPRRAATAGALGDLPVFPTWTVAIRPLAEYGDQADPDAPPTGEVAGRRAPWYPIVWNGRTLLHDGGRILGFDLRTGRPWPVPQRQVPLYDGTAELEELAPLGEVPLAGWPRMTLAAAGPLLAARMGSPVTGPLPSAERGGPSTSSLVVLDLESEGQLMGSYPRRLEGPEWESWEFEGCPLPIGDSLLVGIAARDATGVRSQVASFDLTTGAVRWRTPDLARAQPATGLSAGRVSHSLVTYHQGAAYYHADLGSVTCLDPASGRIRWATSYPRVELASGGYPRRRRAAFRDLTPAVVHDDLVIVAPEDSDRIFALDRYTGALVWATAPGDADEVVQILGIAQGHLIASGDRLVWIDAGNGRIRAAFPAATSDQPAGAIPTPHAAGRGVIAGEQVFWPTQEAILAFDVRLPEAGTTPRLQRRIDLRVSGLTGGNLVAADGVLLMANDRTLAGFVSQR